VNLINACLNPEKIAAVSQIHLTSNCATKGTSSELHLSVKINESLHLLAELFYSSQRQNSKFRVHSTKRAFKWLQFGFIPGASPLAPG
jgi:hypothetical protein